MSRRTEIVLFSLLAAAFIGYGFVPAWRTLNTDFPNYYLAAKLYRTGVPLSRVHDMTWFQRQKDYAGIERRIVSFLSLTVFSAMPALPLSALPPLPAKRVWLASNAALLAACGWMLCRMTRLGRLRVALLVLLAIQPLRTHFLYGQVHVLVLFLLTLAFWLQTKERPVASGLTIAAASALKIYPILFAFYFVRKKQWRALAGLGVGALILGILSIILFGMEANRTYLEEILPRLLGGENADPYNLRWGSFTALFHRLFVFEPELNPRPAAHLPAAFAVLQGLTQAAVFVAVWMGLAAGSKDAGRERLEFAAFLTALLALSPYPSSYHDTVLILPAVLATDIFLRERRMRLAAAFVSLYGLAAAPVPSALPLWRLCFVAAMLVVLIRSLGGSHRKSEQVRIESRFDPLPKAAGGQTSAGSIRACLDRPRLRYVLAFLLLSSASAFVHWRHVRGQGVEGADRIALEEGSLLKAHPAASRGRVAFTALRSPVYTIGLWDGRSVRSLETEEDLLHPSWIPESPFVLAELTGRYSKIVWIDIRENPNRNFRVEAENAAQPVVSPDGQRLAFIRFLHGRGSLWIKPLGGVGEESEVAGARYDVLEAAFSADGAELYFAAQPSGERALFKVGLNSGAVTQVTRRRPARYPAASPDGAWLAYSALQDGSWQLWIRSLQSGAERQLTHGPCNSISPAWAEDSAELIYATDCRRAVGMTGLARMRPRP